MFINSFTAGESALEAVHSRRLAYLMESKRSKVNKLVVVDVNTEIKKAISSTEKVYESTTHLRNRLVAHFKLIKNGPQGDVILPQAFI